MNYKHQYFRLFLIHIIFTIVKFFRDDGGIVDISIGQMLPHSRALLKLYTLENTSLWLSRQRTLLYYTVVPTSAVYYAMTEWRAHAATYYDKYPARAIRRDRRDRLPKTVKYFRDSHNLSPWLPTPLDERVPPRPPA